MNSCLSYGYRKTPLEMISFKGPADAPRASIKGFTAEEMALMKRNLGRLGLRDRIVFNLGEQSGNVWMTELPRATTK